MSYKIILIAVFVTVVGALTFVGVGGAAGAWRMLSQFHVLVYEDKQEAARVQGEILEQDGYRANEDKKEIERLQSAAEKMEQDDETAAETLLDDGDVDDIDRVRKTAK